MQIARKNNCPLIYNPVKAIKFYPEILTQLNDFLWKLPPLSTVPHPQTPNCEKVNGFRVDFPQVGIIGITLETLLTISSVSDCLQHFLCPLLGVH